MNNSLIAELQTMRKIYSFHMGAGRKTQIHKVNVISFFQLLIPTPSEKNINNSG
jgi:hypothetical protein